MSGARRVVRWVFGLVPVLLIAYCTYNFSTAEGRVRTLCSQIEPGMPLADLSAFVREHGLGRGKVHEDLNYVVESKSFGRHGCRVIVKSGVVAESVYVFAD